MVTKKLMMALVLMSSVGTGCASSRPIIRGVDARVLSVDARGVELAFDVDIENQLPFALRSTRGKYSLDIADNRLLSSDSVPALELPAGAVGTMTLPARIEFAELIRAAKSTATAKELPYRMQGALLFPVMGSEHELPFSHEGTVPGPSEAIGNKARDIFKR